MICGRIKGQGELASVDTDTDTTKKVESGKRNNEEQNIAGATANKVTVASCRD